MSNDKRQKGMEMIGRLFGPLQVTARHSRNRWDAIQLNTYSVTYGSKTTSRFRSDHWQPARCCLH